MKNWIKNWWNIDYLSLEDSSAYKQPWSIVISVVLYLLLDLWLFIGIQESVPSFGNKDLKVCALMIVFLICFIYIWIKIGRNIRQGKVFTKDNARLLTRMGNLVTLFSFALGALIFDISQYWTVFVTTFSFLIGGALELTGWMIQRGIDMQKEQELTI